MTKIGLHRQVCKITLATMSKAFWFEPSKRECEKCWNSKLGLPLPTPAAPELILTNDVSWLELGGSNQVRNWDRVLCCTIFSMLYNTLIYVVQYSYTHLFCRHKTPPRIWLLQHQKQFFFIWALSTCKTMPLGERKGKKSKDKWTQEDDVYSKQLSPFKQENSRAKKRKRRRKGDK